MSRKSSFTPELFEAICGRIIEDESLRSVCADKAMPSKSTVLKWIADDETGNLSHAYSFACDWRADMLADEVLHIADTSGTDAEDIRRARLQIDTRKWMAMKLKPKKYGNRVSVGV